MLKRGLRSWPVHRPRNWLAEVNRPKDQAALQCVPQSVTRGLSFGHQIWKTRVANRLGLDITP